MSELIGSSPDSEAVEQQPREERVRQLLSQVEAVITDSHIVYTSGRHGRDYVNKDAVYPHTRETAELCGMIAKDFADSQVDVVAAPAVGGVILSHEIAVQLNAITGGQAKGVYADKDPNGNFVFGRGYADLIKDKKVLAAEDVLNTGGSAKKLIDAVRDAGGIIVGIGVLCNRGGVSPEDLGVEEIDALMNIQMESWAQDECIPCQEGIPINTKVGKGKAFLEGQAEVRSLYTNP